MRFLLQPALLLITAVVLPTGFLPTGATTVRAQEQAAKDDKPAVDFNRQVLPILAKRCFHCHGPDKAESGLRLNSREGLLAEADSGLHAVVAGKPNDSELLNRITETDETLRMPPEGEALSQTEVDLLRQWIADGAEWKKHWAFVPMQRPEVPDVQNADWVKSPIDAFILKRLEQAKLQPTTPADKVALLRRAYYNVTGLPPTPQQVDAFLADDSPDAYEKLIDELLASKHYGEKWARHWLDLVRFAETNSFERDGVKPNAWRYRDYVIRSLNDDKPFDQFVREQLAGDEQQNPTDDEIIATGYYRLGVWDDEPADPLLHKFDQYDDLVRTTGEVFLGLTIGCARCHDHKIDPIPQKDYYSFVAFFAGMTEYGNRGDQRTFSQRDITPPEVTQQYQALDREKADLEKQLREIEQRGIVKMSAPDQRATEGPKREREKVLKQKLQKHLSADDWKSYKALQTKVADVDARYRKLPGRIAALAVAKVEKSPPQMHVMQRGSPHAPGDAVAPAFPAIFAAGEPAFHPTDFSSGRRSALAEFITRDNNLLTARVIANRLWQHHFGRGIVKSANNFGLLGDPPTHPQLLDWLATELVKQNWSLKALHREILLSNTFRMSSKAHAAGLAKDPGNDLFWRFNMRRLSAEELRDSVHMASGAFNDKMYGPGIYPKISREVMQGQSRPGAGWGNSSPEEQARRSIYIHVKRSLVTPLLVDFDFADTDNSCPVRFATVQPAQALNLLNGEFMNRQASVFADRLRKEAGDDLTAQLSRGLRITLSREPAAADIARLKTLVTRLKSEHNINDADALKYACLVMLNVNEFVYLD